MSKGFFSIPTTEHVSKGLAYPEVEPPPAALRLPVDAQPVERPQLIPEINANETERRIEPHAWSGVITKIAKTHRPRILPHVAGLDEDCAAKALEDRQRVLPQWQSTCSCRRQAPQTQTTGSAHMTPHPRISFEPPRKNLLSSGRSASPPIGSIDPQPQAARKDHAVVRTAPVVANIADDAEIVEGARHPSAGLLDVQRHGARRLAGRRHAAMIEIDRPCAEHSVLAARAADRGWRRRRCARAQPRRDRVVANSFVHCHDTAAWPPRDITKKARSSISWCRACSESDERGMPRVALRERHLCGALDARDTPLQIDAPRGTEHVQMADARVDTESLARRVPISEIPLPWRSVLRP